VTEYLYDQTGDPNFASRPALKNLVQQDKLGAISGEGWYRWEAPYAEVVQERDRQLGDLLSWLASRNPIGSIGIATNQPSSTPAQDAPAIV
jgi:3-hydroxybutyryl-CoA dehydrogenase